MREASLKLGFALLTTAGCETLAPMFGMRIPTFRPTLEHFVVTGRTEHYLLSNLASRQRGCVQNRSIRASLDHIVLPNGVRLSCGALKKDSFRIYARRQRQALGPLHRARNHRRTNALTAGPS